MSQEELEPVSNGNIPLTEQEWREIEGYIKAHPWLFIMILDIIHGRG